MAKGDYYYEGSQPGPYPNLFEAGNHEAEAFEEARPLARCEFPSFVGPSRRNPTGEAPCERPAVAKICFSGDGKDMPVCHGHLEKVKEGAKKRANCECTYREPNYDEGEYDWQREVAEDCPRHDEGGEQ